MDARSSPASTDRAWSAMGRIADMSSTAFPDGEATTREPMFMAADVYAVAYREGYYRGHPYYRYVPAYDYGPRFYGWVGSPWVTPYPYYWGGPVAAPWFGYYSGYSAPAPVYASPDLWLTDYDCWPRTCAPPMKTARRTTPQPQVADNAGGSNAPRAITPEMKAMIADEVKRQVAEEQAAAAHPNTTAPPATGNAEAPPPALTLKFFVAVHRTLKWHRTVSPACLRPATLSSAAARMRTRTAT